MLARIVITILLTCAFSGAQSVSSAITGRVFDSSGAIVSNARVEVINTDTGVVNTTSTNETGTYRVFPLSPGAYQVNVQATGFDRLERRDLVLQVSQVMQIDLALMVGNVNETVSVSAAAPVLQSESSSVGQLIGRATIDGMPLPNRAATALVVLTPGAVVISQGSGGENIPIFSVAGGRARNQNYTLDGGNVTNVVGLAVPQQQTSLPMDAMQEFRIISNNYAAEYGHSTGGVVTLSTRSGTNAYHGSVFDYLQNDALNARNFFAVTPPRVRLQQFGGSFGGPIIKDKTHFFVSWEQTRQVTGTASIQTIPTLAERTGDFSNLRDAAGRVIPIYDPANTVNGVRQQFLGNMIPANRIDPVSAALLAFYPAPNRTATITGASNYIANGRPEFHRNIVVGRLDHRFRPLDQLMARYYINDNQTTTPGFWNNPVADPDASLAAGRSQSILGAYTHLFSPASLNEFSYGYVRRANIGQRFGSDQAFAQKLGLTGVSAESFPIVAITGFQGMGASAFRFQIPITDTQLQDSVSINIGRHAMKYGVEYRRGYNQDNTNTSSAGNFGFTPLITGLPGVNNSGNAFASFLLGEANSASISRPDVIASHAAYWAGFAQDDWRVTTRLTLNFGLRWEAEIPRTVEGDRMNAFDPQATNPVSGTPGVITFAGRNGVPRSAYNTDWNNFGPRFGFAYSAGHRTVVRGGGGIFYGPTVSGVIATAASLGFSTEVSLAATQPGINSALVLRNGFPAYTRTPVDQLGAGFGAVPLGGSPTTAVTYFDRNRPTPVSYQFNFNLQHQLGPNILIEAGYIANISHFLAAIDLTINQVSPTLAGAGNAQLRRPFPQFTNVLLINPPVGNSTYHAGFLKIEKRYAAGLSFLAHYTFSKFIDDVASINESGDPGSYEDAYNRRLDKGRSGNDIPQRVLVSAVYELPFLKQPGLISTLFGGWRSGLIATFQSGAPFTVFNSTNATNLFPAGTVRPNVVGDPNLPDGERTLARWFNTAAFVAPPSFQFGNSPRSVLRGPGVQNIDFSLMKDLRVRERITFQLRGEFFNVLNRANFSTPAHTLGTATFGTITNAQPGRTVQVAARIIF